MRANNLHAKDAIDFDLASDAIRIGVDTESREHFYSRYRNHIDVFDTDGEHVVGYDLDVEEKTLRDWLSYVDEKIGWEQTWVRPSAGPDDLFAAVGRRIGRELTAARAEQ